MSYPYIRRTMEASDFALEELRHILVEEVAPAFCFNMQLVAGEWAGWDEDFVRKQVLTRLNHPAWLRKLLSAIALNCKDYAADQWNELLAAPAE